MVREQERVMQLSLSNEFDYNSDLDTDNLTDQWYTPRSIIDRITLLYDGLIDLDPASCQEANSLVRAKVFYNEMQDGLSKKWFGNVFCNPPYSTPKIGFFCEKVVEEYEKNRIKQAVMLLKEGATNAWFRPLRPYLTGYLNKRVKFINGTNGQICESPRSGHCMVYLGENKERFINLLSEEGFCYFPNMSL